MKHQTNYQIVYTLQSTSIDNINYLCRMCNYHEHINLHTRSVIGKGNVFEIVTYDGNVNLCRSIVLSNIKFCNNVTIL